MKQKETLSPIQIRAIRALLECRNVKVAAKNIGIGRSTLQRWMQSEVFLAALRAAETELIDSTSRSWLAGVESAMTVMYEVMTQGDENSIRLKAAIAWVDNAVKWRELNDLELRVKALEDRYNENA